MLVPWMVITIIMVGVDTAAIIYECIISVSSQDSDHRVDPTPTPTTRGHVLRRRSGVASRNRKCGNRAQRH